MNMYEIMCTFGVAALLAAASVQCSKGKIGPGCFSHEDIHKCMFPEEVQHVFHTDVHSVPKYEVVKLHMPERLHRRDLPSGSHMHTTAFGEKIDLWLLPTNSQLAGRNTPVYYAKNSASKPEGIEYRRQDGLMSRVGKIFEDPIKMASLVIGTEPSGRTRVNGFIESKGIAIRSLPRRVVDEYSRKRRSIDGPEDPQYSPYHVVIRMDETFKKNYSHSPVNKTRLPERSARSVEAVPDTLYPEVLVAVDDSVYHAFDTPQGHDIYGLLEYLLAFWNGVDLKYRSIVAPKFRFHISAIVLGEDAGATPYIEENMLTIYDLKTLYTDRAMAGAHKFWYGVKDTFPFDSYDIAATMTRRKLGFYGEVLGKLVLHTLYYSLEEGEAKWQHWDDGDGGTWGKTGQADAGSACQRNDTLKTIEAVTIFTDNGVFSGVHNIAHEMGHVFGARHDFIGDCQQEAGFIMAGVPLPTNNSSDLSPCSLREIQERLDNQQLTCLYNRPKEDGESLPKLMPGKMKNLEEQCEALNGGSSCQEEHPEHSVCVKMFCYDDQGECTDSKKAALDGTQCGSEEDFCLHQRCVSL